jgi:hypothetical protein
MLEDGSEVRYAIALPEGVDLEQPVPLMLALHHSWEGELPSFFSSDSSLRLSRSWERSWWPRMLPNVIG